MDKTYTFFLKEREEAVEVEGDRLDDDGVKVTVTDGKSAIAVFAWAEVQGFTIDG